jgi:predicted SprT family Zn-dependent metalloprotease
MREWLEEWARLWQEPALVERVEVRFDPRLRRSLGRCGGRGKISLHPALRDAPAETLREVVCHEAAHAAVDLRFHRAPLFRRRPRPHGVEWARLMTLAGYLPRASYVPERLPEPLRQAVSPRKLYRYRCPECGAERLATRRVRGWGCRGCRAAGRSGELEVTVVHASS